MAKFICYTEDRGIGKQAVYANVDQISTARFDPETGVLELEFVGTDQRSQVHGDEAKAAVETLKALV
jgi:hypothetical protein